MPANRSEGRSGIFLLLLHGTCFLLVMLYVNMFQFWAWLSRQLGPGVLAKMLPIIVTLVVLLLIALCFVQRVNRGYRIKFAFLGLGVVGTFLALAIPDPEVPIKRIHVAEYIILSFLVRYVLSLRLRGPSLLVFTILVTALYGVHDEMLQGLHSLRYYGWRDIIVNAMAGLSGALLGHGLLFFDNQIPDKASYQRQPVSALQAGLVIVLFAAVIWQIAFLFDHKGDSMSSLVVIPVLLCCGLIGLLYPGTVFNSKTHHGMQTVFWLALGLCVYPLVVRLSSIEFL